MHIVFKIIIASRGASVVDNFIVAVSGVCNFYECGYPRSSGFVGFHKDVKLFFENFFKQIVNIAIIIIERVAVNAAIVHDIPHGDLVQRLFFHQAQKGFHDRLFGKGWHRKAPCRPG